MIEWTAIKIPLGELNLYENNPRTISEKSFNKLKESLDELGVIYPFALKHDRKTILSGCQRQRALLQKFPVVHQVNCVVPHRVLTEIEVEKVILLGNGHHGEWEMDILANKFTMSLEEITSLHLDINLPSIEPIDMPEMGDELPSHDDDKPKYFTCPNCSEKVDLKEYGL